MNPEQIDIMIEVLILGQSGVGKTNLIQRYINDTFSESFKPTIVNDYFKIEKSFKSYKALSKFWDTAGQERFNGITISFFKNADCVVFVYDTSNRESFEKVSFWLGQIAAYCKKPVAMMLIGNKNDLEDERQISIAEASDYAQQNGMLFFETSAKCNKGNRVHTAFDTLIKEKSKILFKLAAKEQNKEMRKIKNSLTHITEPKQKPKNSCCS